jgi:ubiquitin-conjugating enzyme E2 Z
MSSDDIKSQTSDKNNSESNDNNQNEKSPDSNTESKSWPLIFTDPGHRLTLRIMNDIKEFYRNNIKEIQIVVNEDDITTVDALIHGPTNTPYSFGFFYFIVKFPESYPISPPKVSLLTTGNRTVRFNPNLYREGKVCLSILGTWEGPAWTTVNTISTVLLSIQSLMNENPYYNEPGYEKDNLPNDSQTKEKVQNYNEVILHETIRVAVIDMLSENSCDARNMPQVLKNVMIDSFKENYKYFEDIVKSKLKLTNKTMRDPFGHREIKLDYEKLLEKLHSLKSKLIDSDVKDKQIKTQPKLLYSNIVSKYTEEEPKDSNDCRDIFDDMDFSDEELDEYIEESDESDRTSEKEENEKREKNS